MTASHTDLLDGLASLLHAAGIGYYDPAGTYPDDTVGVTFGALPQSPDQAIALSAYPISDDPETNDSVVAVQVRLRGTPDPRTVLDRSAAIFDLFTSLQNQTFGPLHLVVMWRQSGLPMGQDANQRWEWSDTYYCRVNWPTQHRPD